MKASCSGRKAIINPAQGDITIVAFESSLGRGFAIPARMPVEIVTEESTI
jgi:hypothetical protein